MIIASAPGYRCGGFSVFCCGSVSGIATDEDDIVYYVVDDGELTYVFVQTVDTDAGDPGEGQSDTYTATLTNNAGTATLTVTSNSETQVDVEGTVTMTNTNSGSVATFDITKGTVKKGTNYTFNFATNSTSTYKVSVTVGGETLTTSTVIGG